MAGVVAVLFVGTVDATNPEDPGSSGTARAGSRAEPRRSCPCHRARDVLAHLLDDQHLERRERRPSRSPPSPSQERARRPRGRPRRRLDETRPHVEAFARPTSRPERLLRRRRRTWPRLPFLRSSRLLDRRVQVGKTSRARAWTRTSSVGLEPARAVPNDPPILWIVALDLPTTRTATPPASAARTSRHGSSSRRSH